MPVTIHELDINAAADIAAATVIRDELLTEANPDLPGATAESVRTQLIGSEMYRRRNLLALVDGEPAGLGRSLVRNLQGRRDTAIFNVEVRPRYRRGGLGTTLARELTAIAAGDGLTKVEGSGLDTPATRAFWGGHLGLRLGLVERESRLDVRTVDEALMTCWIDARVERAADYRLISVRGECGPELRSAVAELNTAMNDAPSDDLQLEALAWTEDDVATAEAATQARGQEKWMTLALAPDGAPAGLTAVFVNDTDPTYGVQGNTVVIAAHRQRGIGRWLKAAMWRRLRSERPQLQYLLVENAASNLPMLTINEEMGFVEVNRYADWQGTVAALRARLRA